MKNQKKTRRHKKRHSGHSKRPFSTARRKVVRALFVAVVVFIAAGGVFLLKFLLSSDEKTQKTELSLDQVFLPIREPPRTEEEFEALKNEELELAGKLLSDFQGNENSLMVMGNVWNRYGNTVEALKFYEKVLKINPNRPDVYNVMGSIFLAEGKFEEAIGYWRKTLAINPEIVNVHSNIGHALMILGRRDEAFLEFEKEIQISPNSDLTYFLLGQAYLQEKEYEKAKENYEKAIDINPEYANAYYGLATIYTRLGDSDKAKECSEKFKSLKTDSRKELRGRKLVYDDFVQTQKHAALTFLEAGQMYLGAGELQKAEELLKTAAGLDAENVKCLKELASLYQKSGQPLEALQIYKKVGKIEPDNATYHFGIGILSARLKLYDDAEEALRRVITLAPKNPNGYRELAVVYLQKGEKLEQAFQLAERAAALEATGANYFVLSWACVKNKDNARALAAVKRALKLEPDNPEYLRMYKLIQQRI